MVHWLWTLVCQVSILLFVSAPVCHDASVFFTSYLCTLHQHDMSSQLECKSLHTSSLLRKEWNIVGACLDFSIVISQMQQMHQVELLKKTQWFGWHANTRRRISVSCLWTVGRKPENQEETHTDMGTFFCKATVPTRTSLSNIFVWIKLSELYCLPNGQHLATLRIVLCVIF